MDDGELTVGVLGGMGPEATIDFMSDVLSFTGARKDQDHLHLVVDQNPKVPNRQQAMADGNDDVERELAAMASRLEKAGVHFLVMPCNSAHAFEHAIRSASALPFLSIVDVCVEAVAELVPRNGRVALMATDGLLRTDIYQGALDEAGFEWMLPKDDEQQRLMQLIHRIKAGDKRAEVAEGMSALARRLIDRDAELVLAACTEIPLVLGPGDLPVPLVSSTAALAKRTVAIARRELPLPSWPPLPPLPLGGA